MKCNSTIAQLNGKENYSQDIWNRLTVEIEKFNENSEKMLEKRCNEILEIMNRKVSQLLGKTEFEIKKNHKLSEEEYKSIKEEIKEALNITKEIEEENEVLKKTNRKLKFKVDILREEKQLLVEELNQKKLLLFRVKKDYIDPTCS